MDRDMLDGMAIGSAIILVILLAGLIIIRFDIWAYAGIAIGALLIGNMLWRGALALKRWWNNP